MADESRSTSGYASAELVTHAIDALDQFLAEAGRHRLLTPSEELELAKRIERGDLGQGAADHQTCASSSRSPAATRAWACAARPRSRRARSA